MINKKTALRIVLLIVLLCLITLSFLACNDNDLPTESPIQSIIITTLPKVNYYLGDTFDVRDAMITVYYENGESETVPLTMSMISSFDSNSLGEQIITVFYKDKTTYLSVNVAVAPVYSIQVHNMPQKTTYVVGESLDVTDMQILVTYSNRRTEVLDVTKEMVVGFSTENDGETEMSITYGGKYCMATYTVVKRAPDHIEMRLSENFKAAYVVGDEFDITGGSFFVHYNDNTSEDLDWVELHREGKLSYSIDTEKSNVFTTNALTRTVYVFYNGERYQTVVTVNALHPSELFIMSEPDDQILKGKENFAGGQLYVRYNSNQNGYYARVSDATEEARRVNADSKWSDEYRRFFVLNGEEYKVADRTYSSTTTYYVSLEENFVDRYEQRRQYLYVKGNNGIQKAPETYDGTIVYYVPSNVKVFDFDDPVYVKIEKGEFNIEVAGEYTIRLIVDRVYIDYVISVVAPSPDGLEVIPSSENVNKDPETGAYFVYQDETLALTDWFYKIHQNNDTYAIISSTGTDTANVYNEMYVGTSFVSNHTVGVYDYDFSLVTATGVELSCTVPIEFRHRSIVSAKVTFPSRTIYSVGDDISLTGGTFTARYINGSNGDSELFMADMLYCLSSLEAPTLVYSGVNSEGNAVDRISLTKCDLSAFTTETGRKTVYLYYEDSYYNTSFLAQYDIDVIAKAVSIEMTSESDPDDDYILGEDFSLEGWEVLVTYADGTYSTENDFSGSRWSFEGTDLTTTGQHVVRLFYGYKEDNISLSFVCNVHNDVVSIEVDSFLGYATEGDSYDFSKLQFVAVRENGARETVPVSSLTPSLTKAGSYVLPTAAASDYELSTFISEDDWDAYYSAFYVKKSINDEDVFEKADAIFSEQNEYYHAVSNLKKIIFTYNGKTTNAYEAPVVSALTVSRKIETVSIVTYPNAEYIYSTEQNIGEWDLTDLTFELTFNNNTRAVVKHADAHSSISFVSDSGSYKFVINGITYYFELKNDGDKYTLAQLNNALGDEEFIEKELVLSVRDTVYDRNVTASEQKTIPMYCFKNRIISIHTEIGSISEDQFVRFTAQDSSVFINEGKPLYAADESGKYSFVEGSGGFVYNGENRVSYLNGLFIFIEKDNGTDYKKVSELSNTVGFSLSGYTPNKTGAQTITIKYLLRTCTFTVFVRPNVASAISVTAKDGGDVAVIEKMNIDPNKVIVTVALNDADGNPVDMDDNGEQDTKELDFSDVSCTYDKNEDIVFTQRNANERFYLTKTITISYQNVETSISITIYKKSVLDVIMQIIPQQLYPELPSDSGAEDNNLKLTNASGEIGTVFVKYDNGSSEIVDLNDGRVNVNSTQFNRMVELNNGAEQSQTIFITFTDENKVNKETSYNVIIKDRKNVTISYPDTEGVLDYEYKFHCQYGTGSNARPSFFVYYYTDFYLNTPSPLAEGEGGFKVKYIKRNSAEEPLTTWPTQVGEYTMVVSYPGDKANNPFEDSLITIVIGKKELGISVTDKEVIFGEKYSGTLTQVNSLSVLEITWRMGSVLKGKVTNDSPYVQLEGQAERDRQEDVVSVSFEIIKNNVVVEVLADRGDPNPYLIIDLNVGEYYLRPVITILNNNYTYTAGVGDTGAKFIVNPKEICIRAIDETKIYGTGDPKYRFEVSDYLSHEVLGGTYYEEVSGSYAAANITSGDLYTCENNIYTQVESNTSYQSGTTYYVFKSELHIDPIFTDYSVSSYRLTRSGADTDNVTDYHHIYAGVLSGNMNNYSLVEYTPASLKVLPAPLVLTADKATRPYGTSDMAIRYVADTSSSLGFRNNDTFESVFGEYFTKNNILFYDTVQKKVYDKLPGGRSSYDNWAALYKNLRVENFETVIYDGYSYVVVPFNLDCGVYVFSISDIFSDVVTNYTVVTDPFEFEITPIEVELNIGSVVVYEKTEIKDDRRNGFIDYLNFSYDDFITTNIWGETLTYSDFIIETNKLSDVEDKYVSWLSRLIINVQYITGNSRNYLLSYDYLNGYSFTKESGSDAGVYQIMIGYNYSDNFSDFSLKSTKLLETGETKNYFSFYYDMIHSAYTGISSLNRSDYNEGAYIVVLPSFADLKYYRVDTDGARFREDYDHKYASDWKLTTEFTKDMVAYTHLTQDITNAIGFSIVNKSFTTKNYLTAGNYNATISYDYFADVGRAKKFSTDYIYLGGNSELDTAEVEMILNYVLFGIVRPASGRIYFTKTFDYTIDKKVISVSIENKDGKYNNAEQTLMVRINDSLSQDNRHVDDELKFKFNVEVVYNQKTDRFSYENTTIGSFDFYSIVAAPTTENIGRYYEYNAVKGFMQTQDSAVNAGKTYYEKTDGSDRKNGFSISNAGQYSIMLVDIGNSDYLIREGDVHVDFTISPNEMPILLYTNGRVPESTTSGDGFVFQKSYQAVAYDPIDSTWNGRTETKSIYLDSVSFNAQSLGNVNEATAKTVGRVQLKGYDYDIIIRFAFAYENVSLTVEGNVVTVKSGENTLVLDDPSSLDTGDYFFYLSVGNGTRQLGYDLSGNRYYFISAISYGTTTCKITDFYFDEEGVLHLAQKFDSVPNTLDIFAAKDSSIATPQDNKPINVRRDADTKEVIGYDIVFRDSSEYVNFVVTFVYLSDGMYLQCDEAHSFTFKILPAKASLYQFNRTASKTYNGLEAEINKDVLLISDALKADPISVSKVQFSFERLDEEGSTYITVGSERYDLVDIDDLTSCGTFHVTAYFSDNYDIVFKGNNTTEDGKGIYTIVRDTVMVQFVSDEGAVALSKLYDGKGLLQEGQTEFSGYFKDIFGKIVTTGSASIADRDMDTIYYKLSLTGYGDEITNKTSATSVVNYNVGYYWFSFSGMFLDKDGNYRRYDDRDDKVTTGSDRWLNWNYKLDVLKPNVVEGNDDGIFSIEKRPVYLGLNGQKPEIAKPTDGYQYYKYYITYDGTEYRPDSYTGSEQGVKRWSEMIDFYTVYYYDEEVKDFIPLSQTEYGSLFNDTVAFTNTSDVIKEANNNEKISLGLNNILAANSNFEIINSEITIQIKPLEIEVQLTYTNVEEGNASSISYGETIKENAVNFTLSISDEEMKKFNEAIQSGDQLSASQILEEISRVNNMRFYLVNENDSGGDLAFRFVVSENYSSAYVYDAENKRFVETDASVYQSNVQYYSMHRIDAKDVNNVTYYKYYEQYELSEDTEYSLDKRYYYFVNEIANKAMFEQVEFETEDPEVGQPIPNKQYFTKNIVSGKLQKANGTFAANTTYYKLEQAADLYEFKQFYKQNEDVYFLVGNDYYTVQKESTLSKIGSNVKANTYYVFDSDKNVFELTNDKVFVENVDYYTVTKETVVPGERAITTYYIVVKIGDKEQFGLPADGCSDKTTKTISDAKISVEFCDCNSFGTLLNNGGSTDNLTKDIPVSVSDSILSEFNNFSIEYKTFLELDIFSFSGSLSQYSITEGDALNQYQKAYDLAKDIFDNSNTSFTQGINYYVDNTAIVGISVDKKFLIEFGNEESLAYSDYLTVIARLFGYDNTGTFITNAATIASYINSNSPADISNRYRFNGAIYANNGLYIMPFAFKTGEDTLLTFVIVKDGMMSVWISDVATAKRVSNYNNVLELAGEQKAQVTVYGRCILFEKPINYYFFTPTTYTSSEKVTQHYYYYHEGKFYNLYKTDSSADLSNEKTYYVAYIYDKTVKEGESAPNANYFVEYEKMTEATGSYSDSDKYYQIVKLKEKDGNSKYNRLNLLIAGKDYKYGETIQSYVTLTGKTVYEKVPDTDAYYETVGTTFVRNKTYYVLEPVTDLVAGDDVSEFYVVSDGYSRADHNTFINLNEVYYKPVLLTAGFDYTIDTLLSDNTYFEKYDGGDRYYYSDDMFFKDGEEYYVFIAEYGVDTVTGMNGYYVYNDGNKYKMRKTLVAGKDYISTTPIEEDNKVFYRSGDRFVAAARNTKYKRGVEYYSFSDAPGYIAYTALGKYYVDASAIYSARVLQPEIDYSVGEDLAENVVAVNSLVPSTDPEYNSGKIYFIYDNNGYTKVNEESSRFVSASGFYSSQVIIGDGSTSVPTDGSVYEKDTTLNRYIPTSDSVFVSAKTYYRLTAANGYIKENARSSYYIDGTNYFTKSVIASFTEGNIIKEDYPNTIVCLEVDGRLVPVAENDTFINGNTYYTLKNGGMVKYSDVSTYYIDGKDYYTKKTLSLNNHDYALGNTIPQNVYLYVDYRYIRPTEVTYQAEKTYYRLDNSGYIINEDLSQYCVSGRDHYSFTEMDVEVGATIETNVFVGTAPNFTAVTGSYQSGIIYYRRSNAGIVDLTADKDHLYVDATGYYEFNLLSPDISYIVGDSMDANIYEIDSQGVYRATLDAKYMSGKSYYERFSNKKFIKYSDVSNYYRQEAGRFSPRPMNENDTYSAGNTFVVSDYWYRYAYETERKYQAGVTYVMFETQAGYMLYADTFKAYKKYGENERYYVVEADASEYNVGENITSGYYEELADKRIVASSGAFTLDKKYYQVQTGGFVYVNDENKLFITSDSYYSVVNESARNDGYIPLNNLGAYFVRESGYYSVVKNNAGLYEYYKDDEYVRTADSASIENKNYFTFSESEYVQVNNKSRSYVKINVLRAKDLIYEYFDYGEYIYDKSDKNADYYQNVIPKMIFERTDGDYFITEDTVFLNKDYYCFIPQTDFSTGEQIGGLYVHREGYAPVQESFAELEPAKAGVDYRINNEIRESDVFYIYKDIDNNAVALQRVSAGGGKAFSSETTYYKLKNYYRITKAIDPESTYGLYEYKNGVYVLTGDKIVDTSKTYYRFSLDESLRLSDPVKFYEKQTDGDDEFYVQTSDFRIDSNKEYYYFKSTSINGKYVYATGSLIKRNGASTALPVGSYLTAATDFSGSGNYSINVVSTPFEVKKQVIKIVGMEREFFGSDLKFILSDDTPETSSVTYILDNTVRSYILEDRSEIYDSVGSYYDSSSNSNYYVNFNKSLIDAYNRNSSNNYYLEFTSLEQNAVHVPLYIRRKTLTVSLNAETVEYGINVSNTDLRNMVRVDGSPNFNQQWTDAEIIKVDERSIEYDNLINYLKRIEDSKGVLIDYDAISRKIASTDYTGSRSELSLQYNLKMNVSDLNDLEKNNKNNAEYRGFGNYRINFDDVVYTIDQRVININISPNLSYYNGNSGVFSILYGDINKLVYGDSENYLTYSISIDNFTSGDTTYQTLDEKMLEVLGRQQISEVSNVYILYFADQRVASGTVEELYKRYISSEGYTTMTIDAFMTTLKTNAIYSGYSYKEAKYLFKENYYSDITELLANNTSVIIYNLNKETDNIYAGANLVALSDTLSKNEGNYKLVPKESSIYIYPEIESIGEYRDDTGYINLVTDTVGVLADTVTVDENGVITGLDFMLRLNMSGLSGSESVSYVDADSALFRREYDTDLYSGINYERGITLYYIAGGDESGDSIKIKPGMVLTVKASIGENFIGSFGSRPIIETLPFKVRVMEKTIVKNGTLTTTVQISNVDDTFKKDAVSLEYGKSYGNLDAANVETEFELIKSDENEVRDYDLITFRARFTPRRGANINKYFFKTVLYENTEGRLELIIRGGTQNNFSIRYYPKTIDNIYFTHTHTSEEVGVDYYKFKEYGGQDLIGQSLTGYYVKQGDAIYPASGSVDENATYYKPATDPTDYDVTFVCFSEDLLPSDNLKDIFDGESHCFTIYLDRVGYLDSLKIEDEVKENYGYYTNNSTDFDFNKNYFTVSEIALSVGAPLYEDTDNLDALYFVKKDNKYIRPSTTKAEDGVTYYQMVAQSIFTVTEFSTAEGNALAVGTSLYDGETPLYYITRGDIFVKPTETEAVAGKKYYSISKNGGVGDYASYYVYLGASDDVFDVQSYYFNREYKTYTALRKYYVYISVDGDISYSQRYSSQSNRLITSFIGGIYEQAFSSEKYCDGETVTERHESEIKRDAYLYTSAAGVETEGSISISFMNVEPIISYFNLKKQYAFSVIKEGNANIRNITLFPDEFNTSSSQIIVTKSTLDGIVNRAGEAINSVRYMVTAGSSDNTNAVVSKTSIGNGIILEYNTGVVGGKSAGNLTQTGLYKLKISMYFDYPDKSAAENEVSNYDWECFFLVTDDYQKDKVSFYRYENSGYSMTIATDADELIPTSSQPMVIDSGYYFNRQEEKVETINSSTIVFDVDFSTVETSSYLMFYLGLSSQELFELDSDALANNENLWGSSGIGLKISKYFNEDAWHCTTTVLGQTNDEHYYQVPSGTYFQNNVTYFTRDQSGRYSVMDTSNRINTLIKDTDIVFTENVVDSSNHPFSNKDIKVIDWERGRNILKVDYTTVDDDAVIVIRLYQYYYSDVAEKYVTDFVWQEFFRANGTGRGKDQVKQIVDSIDFVGINAMNATVKVYEYSLTSKDNVDFNLLKTSFNNTQSFLYNNDVNDSSFSNGAIDYEYVDGHTTFKTKIAVDQRYNMISGGTDYDLYMLADEYNIPYAYTGNAVSMTFTLNVDEQDIQSVIPGKGFALYSDDDHVPFYFADRSKENFPDHVYAKEGVTYYNYDGSGVTLTPGERLYPLDPIYYIKISGTPKYYVEYPGGYRYPDHIYAKIGVTYYRKVGGNWIGTTLSAGTELFDNVSLHDESGTMYVEPPEPFTLKDTKYYYTQKKFIFYFGGNAPQIGTYDVSSRLNVRGLAITLNQNQTMNTDLTFSYYRYNHEYERQTIFPSMDLADGNKHTITAVINTKLYKFSRAFEADGAKKVTDFDGKTYDFDSLFRESAYVDKNTIDQAFNILATKGFYIIDVYVDGQLAQCVCPYLNNTIGINDIYDGSATLGEEDQFEGVAPFVDKYFLNGIYYTGIRSTPNITIDEYFTYSVK